MSVPKVRLYVRVTLLDGKRPYLDPVSSGNHKLKEGWAKLDGKPQQFDDAVYYLRYAKGGKRVWERVGSDAQQALVAKKRLELRLEAKAEGIALTPDASEPKQESRSVAGRPVLTVKEAAKAYLTQSEVRVGKDGYGLAPRSLETYTRHIHFLMKFDGVTPVTEVDDDYMRRFMAFLRNEDLGDRYVYNILQGIRIFFRKQGVQFKTNILHEAGMGAPKPVKAYTLDQLTPFFPACDSTEEILFKFFLFSMARDKEVQHTEVGDLLFEENVLHIKPKPWRKFRLKGKKSGQAARGRKVPMPPAFMARLKEYVKGMKENDLVFPTDDGGINTHFIDKCQSIAKRAGRADWEEYGLHKFRKTQATQHYKDGVPVPIISRWLGHESIAVTMLYLDIEDSASEHYVNRVAGGTTATAWANGGSHVAA